MILSGVAIASLDAMLARDRALELPHALCTASGKSTRTPCGRLRTNHVFGRVHHRPGSGLRRGKRRLLHRAVCRTRQTRQTGHRPRGQNGQCCGSRRSRADRQVRRRSGLRDISDWSGPARVHSAADQIRVAGSRAPGMAERRQGLGGLSGATGLAQGQSSAGRGLRFARRNDGRRRGELARPHHRRAVCARHHGTHTAGKLVDGQKRHRCTHGSAHPARRLRSVAAGADSGVADGERSARGNPHCRSVAHVERLAHPRPVRSGLRRLGPLSGSSLSLHGQRQFLPLRGHASASMAAQQRRPLSKYGPGSRQLFDTARGRAARRILCRFFRSMRFSTRSACAAW